MKLSIITINYNNLEGLKKTYESVVCQTWTDYEWIIIDGGSTDGSREFIEEHQNKFAYWCSEPDKGVYNAMNKGILKAQGEYLQFLNSGDSLVDIRVVSDFVSLQWNEDIISGNIVRDGNFDRIGCNPEEDELDFDRFLFASVTHPPSYIKKDLFERYGLYDENLTIVSDWKFFIEVLIMQRCSYRHWNRLVVDFDSYGISGDLRYQQLHKEEREKVLKEYKRIVNPIKKRDEKIKKLDLPIMVLLKRRVRAKILSFFIK